MHVISCVNEKANDCSRRKNPSVEKKKTAETSASHTQGEKVKISKGKRRRRVVKRERERERAT